MAAANAGRKARPVNLKIVEGRGPGRDGTPRDSGGRPIKDGPGFVRLPPEAPDFLTGEARLEWERVVPELSRVELLKPVDRAALTAYCLTWQRLVEAQRLIETEGLLATTSQGKGRHPAVAVAEAASKELRSWCAEFGLTPAAESKVAKEADTGGDDNPYA